MSHDLKHALEQMNAVRQLIKASLLLWLGIIRSITMPYFMNVGIYKARSQIIFSIFSTPYAVMPMFATRFVACTGILESLSSGHTSFKLIQYGLYGRYILRIYSDRICFLCKIWGQQAFPLKIYCIFITEPHSLHVRVYQPWPQTLVAICRNMGMCDILGSGLRKWPAREIYLGLFLKKCSRILPSGVRGCLLQVNGRKYIKFSWPPGICFIWIHYWKQRRIENAFLQIYNTYTKYPRRVT